MCPPFERIKFEAKIKNLQGCLRAWSRGDKALGHPCKFLILAISEVIVKNDVYKTNVLDLA